MDKRLLIYHPLRWRHIHHPYDLDDLYDELSPEELEEAGLTKDQLQEVRTRHDGLESVVEVFEEHGSNIFHLQPSLVEMFKNSSVDEICMDSLRTPFEMFYVYFGTASKLRLEGNDSYIDGAYVWNVSSACEGEVSFMITLTRELDIEKASEVSFLKRFALDADFEFSIGAWKDSGVTVKEAFDEHFENPYVKMQREGFESLMASWAENNPDWKPPKTYEENVAEWKPDAKYRDPAVHPALNLVFNAICYLAYEKREVVERYPEFAPERLVRQAINGNTAKERIRGRSKLESIGFRKVFFCGDTIEKRISQLRQESGGEISPHWRRGHWRNQAHGVGLALRKMIWIEPVLVKEGFGETGGHLYIPKKPEMTDPDTNQK